MREIDVINELMVELIFAAASGLPLRLTNIDRQIEVALAALVKRHPLSKEAVGALNKLHYIYARRFVNDRYGSRSLLEKMAELCREAE